MRFFPSTLVLGTLALGFWPSSIVVQGAGCNWAKSIPTEQLRVDVMDVVALWNNDTPLGTTSYNYRGRVASFTCTARKGTLLQACSQSVKELWDIIEQPPSDGISPGRCSSTFGDVFVLWRALG
ncbi:MAG: hypothetical protein J3Q66DRAFT_332678 [Benniella sp.]|nr:MAG: hypothetical protein J3Q66DRAFT_332678 [Benniella sp.]